MIVGEEYTAHKVNVMRSLVTACEPPHGTETQEVMNNADNPHPVLTVFEYFEVIPDKKTVVDLKVPNHKVKQYSRDLDELTNQPFIEKHIT